MIKDGIAQNCTRHDGILDINRRDGVAVLSVVREDPGSRDMLSACNGLCSSLWRDDAPLQSPPSGGANLLLVAQIGTNQESSECYPASLCGLYGPNLF